MARMTTAHATAASSAAAEIEALGELLAERTEGDILLRGLAARLRTLAGVVLSALDGDRASDLQARLAG